MYFEPITVVIACIDEEQFIETSKNIIDHVPVRWINGKNMSSFAYLVNQAVLSCNTEAVVFCSDRVRPNLAHILVMRQMLAGGWGMVGLCRWAFMGFYKQVFRDIGFLDERYIGGGHEDSDFLLRCMEGDISYFDRTEAMGYIWSANTRWNKQLDAAKAHHDAKWGEDTAQKTYIRKLPEIDPYDRTLLGPERDDLKSNRIPWLTGSTILGTDGYKDYRIISETL